MKSLSKSNAGARFETWTPSDLNSALSRSPQEVELEQILALFQKREGKTAIDQDPRHKSGLLSAGARTNVSAWQLQEMDSQPPSAGSTEWFFAESPSHVRQDQDKQAWSEVLDPQDEAALILKRARTQADEIISQARASAEKSILDAETEIDQQKEEARQQGRNEALREIADTLRAIHAIVEETHEWQASLVRQGEQILVDMLKDVSQAMFGEGVHLEPGALQVNLNRIMESAQGLGDLKVFLNPRDARVLDPSWSEYQLLISGNKVRIIPSEKIKPGGCVVKGNTGTVDARVETQLSAILNTLDETQNLAGG